jgi:hypothetical protein
MRTFAHRVLADIHRQGSIRRNPRGNESRHGDQIQEPPTSQATCGDSICNRVDRRIVEGYRIWMEYDAIRTPFFGAVQEDTPRSDFFGGPSVMARGGEPNDRGPSYHVPFNGTFISYTNSVFNTHHPRTAISLNPVAYHLRYRHLLQKEGASLKSLLASTPMN